MLGKSFFLMTVFAVVVLHARAAQQGSDKSTAGGDVAARTLINRYCIGCHSEKLRTADLVLENIDVANISAGAPVWEKVIRKLNAGQMPPAGLPRPDAASIQNLIS